jgi:transcriptional regulator of nitric oxide reductase
MKEEAKMSKKGEVTFHMKQNILLLSLLDKRLINMVSTLHTAAVVDDTSKQSGKTKKNINALLTATHTCMVLIQQMVTKHQQDIITSILLQDRVPNQN